MTIRLLSPVIYKEQEIREIELLEDVTGHAEKILLSQEMSRAKIINKFLAIQIKGIDAELTLNETDKYKIVKRMLDIDIKRCIYELYKAFKEGKINLNVNYITTNGDKRTYSGEVELPEVTKDMFDITPVEFSLTAPISIYGEQVSKFKVNMITGGVLEEVDSESNIAARISILISEVVKTIEGKSIPLEIVEDLSMKVRNVFRTNLDKLPSFLPSIVVEDGEDSFNYPIDILDFF